MDTSLLRDRYEVGFLFGIISLLLVMTIGAYLINAVLLNISGVEAESSSTPPTIDIYA